MGHYSGSFFSSKLQGHGSFVTTGHGVITQSYIKGPVHPRFGPASLNSEGSLSSSWYAVRPCGKQNIEWDSRSAHESGLVNLIDMLMRFQLDFAGLVKHMILQLYMKKCVTTRG